MAQIHVRADLQASGGGTRYRGLHLASAFQGVNTKPRREVRCGEAVGAGGAGREIAAAEERGYRALGLRTTGMANIAAGVGEKSS